MESIIEIDLSIYNKETIVSALYKFTGDYYISQDLIDNSIMRISYELKDNSVTKDFVKEFNNELIDQQIRYNTNKEFGYIRNLIVEQAFKPLSK